MVLDTSQSYSNSSNKTIIEMKTLVNFALSKPNDNLDRASSQICPLLDKWVSSIISEVTLSTMSDELEKQK